MATPGLADPGGSDPEVTARSVTRDRQVGLQPTRDDDPFLTDLAIAASMRIRLALTLSLFAGGAKYVPIRPVENRVGG
jgi:hypothetical protein